MYSRNSTYESLLKGANVTCDDFECVVEIENQWLALTLWGPRTTTLPALSSSDPVGSANTDVLAATIWRPCDVINVTMTSYLDV